MLNSILPYPTVLGEIMMMMMVCKLHLVELCLLSSKSRIALCHMVMSYFT